MVTFVVPLVKAAVACGVLAGAADSVFQWSKAKRRTKILSKEPHKHQWDADRSTKVAISATIFAPVAASPLVLLPSWSLSNLADLGVSLVTGGHLTQHFKRYIPVTAVFSGVTTIAISGLVSIIAGHYSFNGTLSALGLFEPENVIFTLGLGVLSYAYYGFVHQKSLTVDVEPTWLVCLLFAGLLTMTIFPLDRMTVLHLTGADLFFTCGTFYEGLLTFKQFLDRRTVQFTPHEEAMFRYDLILNGLTLVGAASIAPLVEAELYGLAAGAQCLAGGAWLLYIGTHWLQFKNKPLDSANYVNWMNTRFSGYGTKIYKRQRHQTHTELPTEFTSVEDASANFMRDSFVNKTPTIDDD